MNSKNVKANIGLSSLILILIVLSLVILSLLSISSARRDMVLAQRNADSVTDYYQAATKANEFIASKKEPAKADILMDAGLALRVELGEGAGLNSTVDTFKVYIKDDYEIDQSIPVWTGIQ